MQTHNGKLARASSRRVARPASTQLAEEGIASSGITFHLWRLYQHAWLACLFFPFISLISEPTPLWHLVLGLLALLFFAASYTWLMWPHPASQGARVRARSRISSMLFVILSVLVLVFSLVDGSAWLWLFIGTSAIAGVLLPMRSAFAAVVLFTLLPLFITIGTHGGISGIDWWWLIALMLLVRGLGLDMIGVARMGSAIRELHAARRELARMAVIEERLRLSRDLHDLLGQTLSMITLKSELEGARQLLEAAGIDYQIDPLKEALPLAFDAVLAWTVREGVTNVIRHSRARHCRIQLTQKNGTVGAEVLNDGGRREQAESTARPGLGLAGLQERVSALRGQMEAGPLTLLGKEHFRLRVELPIQHDVEALALREERS